MRLLLVLSFLLTLLSVQADARHRSIPGGGGGGAFGGGNPASAFLPSERNDYANWSKSGLLTLGGIPNRSTQCGATVNPIGGGTDDTTNIQNAINACTVGQFVNLGAGTFTVVEGNYILVNKGITLRGQGPGTTILSRATGPGSWSNQAACSSSGAWGATLGCSNPGNNPTQMVIISPLGRFVANALTPCALTADGAQGATSVSVTSGCAGNFSVGQEVLLDEVSGAGWQPDFEHGGTTKIWASSDYRVAYHIHDQQSAFTASIGSVSGTTAVMTVSAVSSGTIAAGGTSSATYPAGAGITANSIYVSSNGTGTGGTGTYNVTCSATCPTVASESMTGDALISGDDCGALPINGTNCGVISQFTNNSDRVTNEIKLISAVSGTTITFDSPLTISYRTSHSANLSTWATPMLQQAGVENLTMNNADSNELEFDNCAFCWAQKVEITNWLGRGIELNNTFRTQLETDYIHEGAWCVPGSGGYNIGVDFASSEDLIENSISRACNKVMVARGAGAGTVVAYNYMDDGYIAGTTGWVEIGLNGSHLVGSHNMLFEGNWAWNADSDNTHGNSIYMTYFRNNLSGVRESFTGEDGVARNDAAASCNGSTTGPLRVLSPHILAWWWSDVGNVLGTLGCTTGWNLNGVYGGSPSTPAIKMLGWDDEDSGYTGDPNIQAVYPAVGPNCATGLNCATIQTNEWLQYSTPVTAWDPSHTGSGFTLSNSNLTATVTATTGNDEQTYSTTSFATTSQKVFWEDTCLAASSNQGHGIASAYVGGGSYLGSNTTSLSFYGTGSVFLNGGNPGSWAGCAAGDTVGLLFDGTAGTIAIADYHAGVWGAYSSAISVGSGMNGGVALHAALDAKNNGEGGSICGNASCEVTGSDLPSGATWLDTVAGGTFSQSPPSSFANSFYLSGKPPWWPSDFPNWPWVTPEDAPGTPVQAGPTGCGGTCSGLPAKARFDAGTPFVNP